MAERPRAFAEGIAVRHTDPHDSFMARWRSHSNAMRHMVKNKIATALIIQDETDIRQNPRLISDLLSINRIWKRRMQVIQ